jgi:hypothetical protein
VWNCPSRNPFKDPIKEQSSLDRPDKTRHDRGNEPKVLRKFKLRLNKDNNTTALQDNGQGKRGIRFHKGNSRWNRFLPVTIDRFGGFVHAPMN